MAIIKRFSVRQFLDWVLAVFERSLPVCGKISTLWGRVHRMLTLKGAHTLHPAVYVRECGLRTIFILQFCQKLFLLILLSFI